MTVNHQINFVNPINGAHTQNVESQWSRFKKFIKHSHGLNIVDNDRYNDYLLESMWRQEFGDKKGSDIL